VCECGISETSVVPLYAHGREERERRSSAAAGVANAAAAAAAAAHLPTRPRGVRVQPRRRHSRFDVIPEDGVGLAWDRPVGWGVGVNDAGDVDATGILARQQAFLQRLLLFVGFFVIMCIIHNT
jgi:hypothetical protein